MACESCGAPLTGMKAAVNAAVADWDVDGPLVALALTLADLLDAGTDKSPAAVARELRATLADLAPKVDDDADRDAALVAGLSSPVGDTTN